MKLKNVVAFFPHQYRDSLSNTTNSTWSLINIRPAFLLNMDHKPSYLTCKPDAGEEKSHFPIFFLWCNLGNKFSIESLCQRLTNKIGVSIFIFYSCPPPTLYVAVFICRLYRNYWIVVLSFVTHTLQQSYTFIQIKLLVNIWQMFRKWSSNGNVESERPNPTRLIVNMKKHGKW